MRTPSGDLVTHLFGQTVIYMDGQKSHFEPSWVDTISQKTGNFSVLLKIDVKK